MAHPPLAIVGLGALGPPGMGREPWLTAWNRRDTQLLSPPDGAGTASKPHESVWPGMAPDSGLSPTSIDDAVGHLQALGVRLDAQVLWGFRAEPYLGDRGLRGLDRLTRMTLSAAREALSDAGVAPEASGRAQTGVAWGTAFGSLEAIEELHRVVEVDDPRFISPTRFPNTVVNATAGQLAIWEKLHGPNITLSDDRCAFYSAITHAQLQLACGAAERMLVGASDALSLGTLIAIDRLERRGHAIRRMLGQPPQDPGRYSEGSAFFVVEPGAENRIAAVHGVSHQTTSRVRRRLGYPAQAARGVLETVLQQAGWAPHDVDAVFVDQRAAVAPVTDVLGQGAVIVSTTPILGDAMAASAAWSCTVAIGCMHGGPFPPSLRGAMTTRPERVVLLSTTPFGRAAALAIGR